MSEDVFSLLSGDALIALLLYVGPHPRDIGNLCFSSRAVRARFADEDFAQQYAALYLGVRTQPVEGIVWTNEIKECWKMRKSLFDQFLAIQGQEMRALQAQKGRPVLKVEKTSSGHLRVEHIMKMVTRSEALSESLPVTSSFDLQMMVLQPSDPYAFPLLPLQRSHAMYYEVKLTKSLPKNGGAIIGYALPTLKTVLPGRTTYSFGLALDRLTVFNGFSDLPEYIPSPRSQPFKPKKGDVFGVGLIHSLTNSPSQYYSPYDAVTTPPNQLHADSATFYVTFNGKVIYHKLLILCAYHVVPTIVLSSFGDALEVNFGIPKTPTNFFAQSPLSLMEIFHPSPFTPPSSTLATAEAVSDSIATSSTDNTQEEAQATPSNDENTPTNRDHHQSKPPTMPSRVSFYDYSFVFDPYTIADHLPEDAFTNVVQETEESAKSEETTNEEGAVVLNEKYYYWQTLAEQRRTIPVATDEMLWMDPSYHLFGGHHQSTLDFLKNRIENHGYKPIIDMENVAKCMEAANLQNMVSNGMMDVEKGRTLLLSALTDEQVVQTMLNHPEPLEVLLQWTESLVRYWERRLCWDLISFLKKDKEGSYTVDHVPILFSWVILDYFTFNQQIADSPLYDRMITISNRWHGGDGLETCVVRMLKAVCQMFWTSRANHLVPGTVPPVRQPPNVAYLGIHWTTHLFLSLKLLPNEGQGPAPSLDQVQHIIDGLSEAQFDDLMQATICAFVGSHCMHHSPASMDTSAPWMPGNPAEAVKAAIDSIYEQKRLFHDKTLTPFKYDPILWRQDLFNFLGGAVCAIHEQNTGTSIPYPPGMDLSGVFWYFSRYSDRFLELTSVLRTSQGDHAAALANPITNLQVKVYWNEKCAFANFWYGEAFLREVFSELFPAFNQDSLVAYRYVDTHGIVTGRPPRAPIIRFGGAGRLLTSIVAITLVSAGVVIGTALTLRRMKTWLRK